MDELEKTLIKEILKKRLTKQKLVEVVAYFVEKCL